MKFFSLLFLFSLLNLCAASSNSTDPPAPKPTVYEILPQFGLPSGLLPDSVVSYTLSDDGQFEVNLEKACYIQFDYLVYYEKKITGKLSIGSISNLKGIQVQRFYFFWFDVDEIKVDLPPSGSIYFTVGIINKELEVDQFLTVRSCKDKAVTLTPVVEQNALIPVLLSLLILSLSHHHSASETDVHDLLPLYNLPKGLLPSNIKSYSLSTTDTTFTVEPSASPCYIKFNDQLVHLDRIIKGKLEYGEVSQVSGIQAKKFFFWVSVDRIEVDEKHGMIEFFVGSLSQKLPAKDFETIRSCRAKEFAETLTFLDA
ncbi:transmembrane protein [Perilla frutescens var. hirtella]|nr:transmembrane protein [Perilla frutescens var. hirtella]